MMIMHSMGAFWTSFVARLTMFEILHQMSHLLGKQSLRFGKFKCRELNGGNTFVSKRNVGVEILIQ